MGGKDDLLQYRTEGIIRELATYFEIRYAQLTRIKPSLGAMYGDLLWRIHMESAQQLAIRGEAGNTVMSTITHIEISVGIDR